MHVISLRDRKKDQTRRDLSAAAIDIVATEGAERLTAEAIADRVGVSRRTFFNYFPSVDAACAHSAELLLHELTEELAARPRDEDVWETMRAFLTGGAGSPLIERLAILCTTREHSLQARHLAQDHIDAFVAWLTQWLTDRLGPDTDELYAATLAASVSATAEATLRIWSERHAGSTEPAVLAAYPDMLTRSLGLLRTGFDTAALPTR